MGEGREYVSRSDELGNIHISEEVLAVIAAAAALEVEGVGGLAANLGTDLAELLGKKNLSRGIRLQVEERYGRGGHPCKVWLHHSGCGPRRAGSCGWQHRGHQRSHCRRRQRKRGRCGL